MQHMAGGIFKFFSDLLRVIHQIVGLYGRPSCPMFGPLGHEFLSLQTGLGMTVRLVAFNFSDRGLIFVIHIYTSL